jgi:hypothetical protein
MTYLPPAARVIEATRHGDVVVTVVRFDNMPTPPFSPASLFSQGEQKAILKLHAMVARSGDQVTFETYDPDASTLPAGSVYDYIALWSPDQLRLAQDRSRVWTIKQFQAQDAVAFKIEGGTAFGRRQTNVPVAPGEKIVRGGWDHEHCELCWQNISPDGDQRMGYTDGSNWICEACHAEYVASGFAQRLGDRA